jgi:chitinase
MFTVRTKRLIPMVLSGLLLCACAPGRPVGTPAADAEGLPIPFAPYVEVTTSRPDLTAVMEQSPARRFVLAFALARESRCEPTWGEALAVDDPALLTEIAALRARGGSVTAATGGASGTYLETSCATATELAGAYRRVLAAIGADRLDVDVEEEIPAALVADALAAVHRDLGTGLTVTVEVLDAQRGLPASAMTLLRALAERGTDVTVNAMVMNFPPEGHWRDSLLEAAETVTTQIGTVWPQAGRQRAYRRLGLTFMAGRNDTGPVTTLDDANAVRAYARAHRLGFLGFWSLARDNGDCPGRQVAGGNCSGIAQTRYDFTRSLA